MQQRQGPKAEPWVERKVSYQSELCQIIFRRATAWTRDQDMEGIMGIMFVTMHE